MEDKNDIVVTLTPKAVASVVKDDGEHDASVKVQVSIKPRTTTNIPLVDGLRKAIDQAENVNASIDDKCNLTITSKDGAQKTINVKGDPGDVSKEYLERELNKLKPLIYAGL